MTQSSQLARLAGQLETLLGLVGRAGAEALAAKPKPDKWSLHEIAAHLGRYHEVFLNRMNRILNEDGPQFERYRAEGDEQWPIWPSLATAEVLERLQETRVDLTTLFEGLSEEQLNRVGVHPYLGAMTVAQWLEFFLLHEAHHLYAMLFRTRRTHEGGASRLSGE